MPARHRRLLLCVAMLVGGSGGWLLAVGRAGAQTIPTTPTTRTSAPPTTKPPGATTTTAPGATTTTKPKPKTSTTKAPAPTVPQPSTTLLTGSTVAPDQPDPSSLPAGSQVIPSGRFRPLGLLLTIAGFGTVVLIMTVQWFLTRPNKPARWTL